MKKSAKHMTVLAMLAVACMANVGWAAKRPAKKASSPDDATPALPGDANQASLRVSATMSLYELDASPKQLRLIRTLAAGAAMNRPRSAAKGAGKLMGPMNDLQKAILSGADDGKIADLRNALVEAASNDDVQLDDPVRPTAMALLRGPAVTHALHASQLAAYLAVHADEVTDPVERMLSAITEGADADSGETPHDTATDVAELVAGDDAATAKPIADKVEAWLKAHASLDETAIANDRPALEASAKKVIGDVSPVQVLGHYFDYEMATLLSNPQLPEAVDALLASKRVGQ